MEEIVREWVALLTGERLYGPDDPLFPSTAVGLTAGGLFGAVGLSRSHWANADPIRKIFRKAFEGAGLSYFNPHSFRKTLVQIGHRQCRTPEEFKAWSQNLGHEHVLTTFTSYGAVSSYRQAELLERLSNQADSTSHIVLDSATRRALELILESSP